MTEELINAEIALKKISDLRKENQYLKKENKEKLEAIIKINENLLILLGGK